MEIAFYCALESSLWTNSFVWGSGWGGAGRVNSSEIACYAIQAAHEYTERRLGLTDSVPSKHGSQRLTESDQNVYPSGSAVATPHTFP